MTTVAATAVQAYKTVPAISAMLCEGVPVELETTAPDFLCMGYDEALHALEHGYAATVTPDVWVVLKQAVTQEVAA
jgi:hypothetical protein